MYYIGIDLGGINIRAGIVDAQHQLCQTLSIKTSMAKGFDGLCVDMVRLCEQLVVEYGITLDEVMSIGIACPGMINDETGEIIFSNNLDIYHSNLRERMALKLPCPVYCANDSNAVALGEYIIGSGEGVSSMVVLNLGIGVGSGIVMNGKIYNGFNYSGGEFGHMVIEVGGRRCTCGRKGCLETYVSTRGFIQTAKEVMKDNNDSLLWSLVKGDISCVSESIVFEARDKGDALANRVVDTYIDYLSVGLANIVNALQPERIAIGGFVFQQEEWLMDALQTRVDAQVFGRFGEKQTKILAATLGNDGGIIGASLLGRM